MASRSTVRRAAGAAAACFAGAAALPATGEAATPTSGCKMGSSNITWTYNQYSLKDSALFAAASAAMEWTNDTNANLTLVSGFANINIGVADLQGAPYYKPTNWVGMTSEYCTNGIAQGETEITLDTQYLQTASYDMMRQDVTHELGHALGLSHNNATSGKCANGNAKPTSVMAAVIESAPKTTCGPVYPSADDIAGVNSLYK
jgi:hypothetical protein